MAGGEEGGAYINRKSLKCVTGPASEWDQRQ